MKTTITILMLNCFCFCSIQIANAQTLIENGKTWTYLLAGSYPNDTPNNDLCYRIGRDTMISGIQYAILESSYGCNNYSDIRGFIRETVDSLVYFRTPNSEDESLLYDFGLDIGDSIDVGIGFAQLDSFATNDEDRKIFHFSIDGEYYESWIDGVGSDIGVTKELITGGTQSFTCCILNNEILYHNPNFNNCFYTSSFELLNQDKNLITISSNRNGFILIKVTSGSPLEGHLQLFSVEGKHLETVKVSDKTCAQICPPGSGTLFYRFINSAHKFQQGKIFVY